ncbi:MAG: TIR domain-containing protein [Bacteroidota bacterium]|nr:TIR domain-containing protein [Bacteroidota bacterium]
MSDIFLSYSRSDGEYAVRFAGELRSRGANIWMDTASLTAAETWSAEIVSAIRNCQAFIVLLSPRSVLSQNVTKELALASELQKTIVPIELEQCELSDAMMYALAGLHRISAQDKDSVEKWILSIDLSSESQSNVVTPRVHDSHGVRRLAVLPFDDLSPARDNDWFAEGMTDELIGTLSLLRKLIVNPRNDVIYYKGRQPTLSEVASDLGVRYVVSGSVQKVGEKIRLRVSLSDAVLHQYVWTEKYDGTFDDIFDFEDKTVRSISDALALKLTPDEEKQIDTKLTDNSDAYELYLRAHEYFQKHTKADYERALLLYDEAIKLDPNFAAAYGRIANICYEMHRYYGADPIMIKRVEDAVSRIKEIEGESYRWNMGMCQKNLRLGNKEESLIYAKRAAELAPEDAGVQAVLGFAFYALGDLPSTAKAWQREVELRNSIPNAHFNLIGILFQIGDAAWLAQAIQRALPVYERHLRFRPEDHPSRVQYAYILQWSGKSEAAKKEADALCSIERLDGSGSYNLTCLLTTLGEYDKAVITLRRGIAAGLNNADLLRNDPDLAPLRKLPEFQEILKNIE